MLDWKALNDMLAGKTIRDVKQAGGTTIEINTEDGMSVRLYGGGGTDRCGYGYEELDVTVYDETGNTIFDDVMRSE